VNLPKLAGGCASCTIFFAKSEYFDGYYKSKKISKKVLTFGKVCGKIYKLSARGANTE